MMKKSMYLMSILLLLAALLAACTTAATPAEQVSEATTAPEAVVEQPAEDATAEEPATTETGGGTVVMARDSEPLTLNPIGASDNGSIFMIVQIFDTLVETRDAPVPQPGLAESWTVSDDSMTWTFNLRPGTQFSNGDPVTCEDVKFSIDRFADPEINVSYGGFGSSIESTECVDETTFVIQLNRVEGAFLDYLSTFIPSIIPQAVYEQMGDEAFGEMPIGSGPYMVKEWVRGQRIVLERNPYYWKEGQPYVDEFVIEYIPDDNTRMLKIESGEAQIATEVPYSQLERIDALDGIHVQIEDVMAWDAVWFNVNMPPLDDPNVIQALNYATPKEAMLQSLLYGAGEIANHVIARVKYWDPTVEPYPYDIERAQQLMAESTVPDGFTMSCLIVAGDQAERQQAETLQQEWAKIGVTIEIETVDIGSIWDRWTSGEEMCFTYPGSGLSSDALSDDNLAVVFFDYTGGADSFWTNWNNQQATDLVAQAGGTIDEDVRTQTFHELQRLVMSEYPAVPLFFIKARTAVADNIQGFKTLPVKWWNLEEVRIEN
jgi:peptide/nickel transport system substrate-binding protein